MKKLLMFDFDGTICDTLSLFHNSFCAACHELGIVKYDSLECFLDLFDRNLYESIALDGIGESDIDKIQILLAEELQGKLEGCTVFAGLLDVLYRLKEAGYLLYVITSSISSVVEAYLKSRNIAMFSGILGADKGRSKIDKIIRVVKEHPGYTPYYVGDTAGDILEGNRAGCVTVGVAWGWHGADRLHKSDVDILSRSPGDFYDDVEGFVNGTGSSLRKPSFL